MAAREETLKPLMIASQAGDEAAYRALLLALAAHLRAYYKRRLKLFGKRDAEVEDLVQTTLMAIHMKRNTYSPTELLTPWVYAIAHYKLIDHLRQTRATLSDSIDDVDELVARDDALEVESNLDVAKLLAQLPTRTGRVVQSVKIEGLSTREAALKFGMKESAVKVLVHRALRRLSNIVLKDNLR
ncbi:MAG: sigma-70 family RNA polymerase sigma factor [Beijerinckiaceae bacterium]|nr:sigma-70 family RNA polymerase sigma factor [Beijerinckiaceae bacterium]